MKRGGEEKQTGAASDDWRNLPANRKRELLAQLLREREEADLPSVPVSAGQQSLWVLQQIASRSWLYHVTFAARITSAVDADALRRAFQLLLDRHAALRTTYHQDRDSVRQRTVPNATIDFAQLDAREWTAEALRDRVLAASRAPFDLARGPICRVRLFTQAIDQHVLLFVVHHIAFDGWSLWILLDELKEAYAAELSRRPHRLPEIKNDYRDFVAWQTQMQRGSDGEAHFAYWKSQLSEPLPTLNLPIFTARRGEDDPVGAAHSFEVNSELTERLRALADETGTSLYCVLLAAFKVLLYRYTGQNDLIVGAPMSGRLRSDFEDIVGYFVNPVPIRSRPQGQLRYSAFLKQVHDAVVSADEHQAYPFALLVDQLNPPRDAGRSPVFQSRFVLQRAHKPGLEQAAAFMVRRPSGRIELGALSLEPYPLPQQDGQYDLTIQVDAQGPLFFTVDYNIALLDPVIVEQMSRQFQVLLRGITTNPDQEIATLPLITRDEQNKLQSWNDTSRPYPRDRCIHEQFELQARRMRDSVAIIDRETSLSYAELNERANQLASYLKSCGVATGCRVAVCLKRSSDMVVSLLAVLKAGAAYVPLDPEYPEARLAFMLQDTDSKVLITNAQLRTALPEVARVAGGRTDCDSRIIICLDRDGSKIRKSSRANPHSKSVATEPAYVMYTSGSTGKPKGVEVLHRGVLRLLFGVEYVELNAEQVVLQLAPFSFDASTFEIWGALLHGGRLVMYPGELPTPRDLEGVLVKQGVTTLWLTGSLFNQIVDEAPKVLRRVNQLLIGGEALSVPHVRRALRELSHTKIINGYGPTENTTFTCCYRIPRQLDDRVLSIPIGRPIANTKVYVLDADLQRVPNGVAGELFVGGDGLARGYLNRDDLNAKEFVANPFEPGQRLYRTGDTVRYLDDGCLEFLGRLDGQVKIRGFRIETGEIEAVLSGHDEIKQAAVIVREDDSKDKRLAAFVVKRADANLNSNSLRDFLRRTLPEYMVPSYVFFVEKMPLNPNGKIDRNKLEIPADSRGENRGRAPQTEIEKMIAAVWKDVLQLEKVDVEHNFFDLGGHSLLLAKVHDRLRASLDCEFAVMDLFRHPNIRSLARFLHERSETSRPVWRRKIRQKHFEADQDIAIVGMAGRFPGAADIYEFWKNLKDGVESITTFAELDDAGNLRGNNGADRKNRVSAGAVLDGVDLFDAAFFGYSPRDADSIDPQQRLFLECAWQSLENAGYDASRYDGLIGIYAGATPSTYGSTTAGSPILQAQISTDADFLTSRVAYKLGLKGPSVGIQTACSSSLVAVHHACRALVHGECDMALAGGVSIRLPQRVSYVHEPGSILSADGHCRTFDCSASGTVAGRGMGIVVLKRLDEAIAQGDTVHAVIKGSAINNDGSSRVGFTAPSADGQAEVVTLAHADAGIDPESISYVEAHGTATELGDPIEVEALSRAFAIQTNRRGFCAVGSVKTNIGHLDAAAGVTGLIKTVLAMTHQQIPPSLHYSEPNPKINFDSSPFYVANRLMDWKPSRQPRRAGVSSFGMGGTNAHVVIEEAPVAGASSAPRPHQLLVVSAKTAEALDDVVNQLGEFVSGSRAYELADAAYTLQVGRKALSHRAILVSRDRDDAARALRNPKRLRKAVYDGGGREATFLFPGQGAQFPHMGRELYELEPVFRTEVDRCCQFLEGQIQVDLRDRLYPDDLTIDANLTDTWLAQPALFVIEYALAKLWMSWGVHPKAMIGHSLGEYTAACLSGVFSLQDALTMVATRGRLMQQMASGRMISIPLPADQVEAMLEDRLSLAAVNAPARCVVSGPSDEIDRFVARLQYDGTVCRDLHTSHAFHSDMVDTILDPFADALQSVSFGRPEIPFLSTVSGNWATADEVSNPDYWSNQLRGTVRYSRCIRTILHDTDHVLLEVGPGDSLCMLAQQHREGSTVPTAVASMRGGASDQSEEQVLLEAAGRLWLHGVSIDWEAFQSPKKRRRVPMPTYPFQRERHWVEVNQKPPDPLDSTRSESIDDWFYVPSWRRTIPAARESMPPSTWCIFCDAHGFGTQLASRLTSQGHMVVTVTPGDGYKQRQERGYVLDPLNRGHYDQLVKELSAVGRMPTEFVHCWTVQADGGVSDDEFSQTRARDLGFYSLLYLIQAVTARGQDGARCTVFGSGVQDVAGTEPLYPDRAMVVGLCKVIALEDPSLTCRHVDLVVPECGDFDSAAVSEAMAELGNGFSDPVVALRGPHRFVRSFEPLRMPAPRKSYLQDGGVYLITGGLGGVGMEMAEYISREHPSTLILTSRTGLAGQADGSLYDVSTATGNDDKRLHRLRKIQSSTASIHVGRADVTRHSVMSALVQAILRRWGRIDGVIHTAGENDSGCLLGDATPDYCERQFAPKLRGLRVLDDVTRECKPRFRLIASSLASVLGVTGYGAYSAAHAFMDAYVWKTRRSRGPAWNTVNWDNWSTGARASGQVSAGIASTLMSAKQGQDALSRVVRFGDVPQIAVSTIDLNERVRKWQSTWPSDRRRTAAAAAPSRHRRPILNTEYVMPTEGRERILADIWQDLLGIERIGIHDNFFELGGDSVVGIQIIGRARDAGLQLRPRQLFESRTIAELAVAAEDLRSSEDADCPASDRSDGAPKESLPDVSDAEMSVDELDSLMDRISGDP